jgi:hypothetical protein
MLARYRHCTACILIMTQIQMPCDGTAEPNAVGSASRRPVGLSGFGLSGWQHGPRGHQGSKRLYVPGNRRVRVLLPFRVLFRVVSELSVQNTPREPRRCGGFRAVNRTLTRLWNKKIFGRQRPQTPYRACVRGRPAPEFSKIVCLEACEAEKVGKRHD